MNMDCYLKENELASETESFGLLANFVHLKFKKKEVIFSLFHTLQN